MKIKSAFWLMIAACFVLTLPSISSATPVLKIEDGINAPIYGVFDSGVWRAVGSIGRWNIIDLIGELRPLGLDLGGIIASYGGPGNLKITFTNSYAGGGVELPFDMGLSFVADGGAISYRATADAALLHALSAPGSVTVHHTPAVNFSLTQELTLTNSGYYYFDALLNGTPAPEPSSLLLLGSGLVGAAIFVRRKT